MYQYSCNACCMKLVMSLLSVYLQSKIYFPWTGSGSPSQAASGAACKAAGAAWWQQGPSQPQPLAFIPCRLLHRLREDTTCVTIKIELLCTSCPDLLMAAEQPLWQPAGSGAGPSQSQTSSSGRGRPARLRGMPSPKNLRSSCCARCWRTPPVVRPWAVDHVWQDAPCAAHQLLLQP